MVLSALAELLVEIWCSQGFRDAQTRALAHSWTDRPDYRMPGALFFNGGAGIKPMLVDHKFSIWYLSNCHKYHCKLETSLMFSHIEER